MLELAYNMDDNARFAKYVTTEDVGMEAVKHTPSHLAR